jgi:hypothetical protein
MLSEIIDITHITLMLVILTGSVWMPYQLLPLFILYIQLFFSRYHSYCWLTKLTNLQKDEDEEELPSEIHDIITAVICINSIYSLYRMSILYNFKIFPNMYWSKELFIIFIILWTVTEITIYKEKINIYI